MITLQRVTTNGTSQFKLSIEDGFPLQVCREYSEDGEYKYTKRELLYEEGEAGMQLAKAKLEKRRLELLARGYQQV